ncbi:MAG: sulfatase-like hydrolase/transferase [Verrucomicrobia bacterium]|nr:sulfatase-like hydrolase/transferase [Verrucomicrobiota bacterium]
MKKVVWFALCVAGLIFSALLLVVHLHHASSAGTNVLLITLDTTRADRIGCYGYTNAVTPNLDALAFRGTSFEKAYTCVPITLPAHATMLTGLYPPEHGLRVNGRKRLGDDVPLLQDILKDNGYETAAFIACSILSSSYGLERGFDVYDENEEAMEEKAQAILYDAGDDHHVTRYRWGDVMADATIRWLESWSSAKGRRKPFFCWTHFYDPHEPRHLHEETVRTATGDKYDAEVAFMDHQIGRILDFLAENDLTEDTLIIAVGDHGEGLGEHGESTHAFMLYDSTLHVPLILSQPGRLPESRHVSSNVSTVQLFPTILKHLGLAFAAEDYEPALNMSPENKPAASLPIYSETQHPYWFYGWSPLQSLITEDWKYIRTAKTELFRRENDPGELSNLAEEHPDAVAAMEQELAEMEAGMMKFHADEVTLSDQEIRQLESLGYLSGGSTGGNEVDLPDVKDMIHTTDVYWHIMTRFRRGDFGPETLGLCRKLASLSPGTARFQTYLGIVLSAQGSLNEAVATLRTAVELDPSAYLAHNQLGILLMRRHRPRKAIEHFQLGLRANPEDARMRFNLQKAYVEWGATLIAKGSCEEAVESLRSALTIRPRDPVAHYNLGVALAAVGKRDKARRHFEEALAIKPDYQEARAGLDNL